MANSSDSPPHTVDEYLSSLKKSPKYGPQVVAHKSYTSSSPCYAQFHHSLHPELAKELRNQGIQLYSHQGEALDFIEQSCNVLVCTPTSSGKSMVYNIPVLNSLLTRGYANALYIFPLKALSQDQLKNLTSFAGKIPSLCSSYTNGIAAIYDGDTTSYQRRKIRVNTPPVVITNPEMIHLSLLPHHESWAHFLKNLRYIIIDEIHTYRGVFGAHFSWVMRRLRRLAYHYGASPQFILSSATIGNPKKFSETILDDKVSVVSASGAPQAKKSFLLLNPWDSPAYTASQLLEASMKRNLRTIVYTQSRKMTELVSMWTAQRLGRDKDKLSSYRAGFLPEERREIEARLSDGSLTGVISTSALELGIDIGDLDICILVGYPGSMMASWQRGGRVGRGGRESAVILIGSDDALDQYYMKNPDRFFGKDIESAAVNPHNAKIMSEHLHCAAAEYPIQDGEALLQNESVRSSLHTLVHSGVLLQGADDNRYYASRKRPQRYVHLRGSGDQLTIIDSLTGVVLGEVDAVRALKECHGGAVYLHRMRAMYVEKLDLLAKDIVVTEKRLTFYTRPLSTKDTEILSTLKQRSLFGCRLAFGELKVTEKVTGYQKRNNGTNKLISTTPLELPEQVIETTGLWLTIPSSIMERLEDEKHHFMGGLHALEHLLISIFPILILCDRNDVGGISCPHHEQTIDPSIFIYDGAVGGSGLSLEAFENAERLFSTATEIISTCECENGCPSCVHSPKCGSGNRPIDKHACLRLITAIAESGDEGSGKFDPIDDSPALPQPYSSLSDQEKDTKPGNSVKRGLDALPVRWGVFDLETQLSAEEVGGWGRAEMMKLSVAVVYDSLLEGCVTYIEDEVEQLVDHLMSLELVVGFNNKRFDNRVLSPYTEKSLDTMPAVDLLEEIHKYLGYRISLNGIAKHTLNIEKSGDGLRALQWYRDGEIEKLAEYCRKDVEITRDLFLHTLEKGCLFFQNKAKKKVRLPLSLDGTILKICGNL